MITKAMVALLVMTTVGLHASSSTRTHREVRIETQRLTQVGGMLKAHDKSEDGCWDCGAGLDHGCSANEHLDGVLVVGSPGYFSGTKHEGCTESPDPEAPCQEHAWCNTFDEELLEAVDLVNAGHSLEDFRALLHLANGRVVVNSGASSISLLGCGGRDLAFIELNDEQRAIVVGEILTQP